MRGVIPMKKVLLLGGSRYTIPVIDACHDLGYKAITCDYLPDNIAHKYADEYHNVSIIDKDATLALARALKVDGVMSFACDPGVTTAAYVAEQMGLPQTGPYESVCILQNKARFRQFLTENGFNVPTARGYRSAEEALKDVALFHWPVIVKPADSAGSKGVARIDDPARLREAIEHALSFSHCNEVIIEDFLEKVGHSSDSDSFSVDGELKFLSFSAQRFDAHCQNPYTPAAYSWPATLSEAHQHELRSELQRLLRLLGMGTSLYNIEVRECTDGKAYIMECSPRGGGNRLSEVLRYATGVDLIANAVRAAVGEPVVGVEQRPYQGHWAEIVLHSEMPGTFRSLWVSDAIRPNVVEEELRVEPGDPVGGFTGANEAVGSMILRFDTAQEMESVLQSPEKYVRVVLE